MRGNLKKLIFWKKFTRHLLVGISAVIVLAYFQSTPTILKADDDGNDSCQGTVVARSGNTCYTFDLNDTCPLPLGWVIDPANCPANPPPFPGSSTNPGGGTCTPQTNQTNRCQDTQRCYYTTTYNTNSVCGNTTESLISCQNDSSCGNQPGTCSQYNEQITRCINQQLCRVTVTHNNNNVCGARSESTPFSCQNASQCGFVTTSSSTSATTTIRSSTSGDGVNVTQHNTQTQTNNQTVTIRFD